MDAYYQYIQSQNQDNNNLVKLAFQELCNRKYVYDPAFDYLPELIEMEKIISKRQMNWDAEHTRQVIINMYFDEHQEKYTMEQKHLRIYNHFISCKWQEFRRNYKPSNEDDGLNYMFITLNFEPHVSVNVMKMETERFVKLAIFKNCTYKYVYEYHTKGQNHPHTHILMEMKNTGTISLTTILQKAYQRQGVEDIMKIDYLFSWAKKYDKKCRKRSEINAYILGNKTDRKIENVENDKIWRIENNLNEFYQSS